MPLSRYCNNLNKHVKKVKQSLNRPGQALRIPGDEGSHVPRQSGHGGVCPCRLYPQEIFLVFTF